ncbi:MAG: lysylphosphatidylglycerol synthase transmembrane domain-containing protein [Lachnospiraceae bacterium]|nr:flippase-like domain-containing protein [Robinsoniella sp.]MDY3765159.1 lysylphosphatidylglycerol synthase transmembrane domain-containing protein [Lachnospiraceae bacterium]
MGFLKKNKKHIVEILFLILLCAGTFLLLFRDQELGEIWKLVQGAKKSYLCAGVIFVILFVCGESTIIFYMMRSLGIHAPFLHCIKYSFIGFFFSCITPSATGGQPAQIYYMNKEGINVSVATLVLMIVTITYKFVLVVVGAGVILFRRDLIFDYMDNTRFLFYLGLFLNVGCITLMMILVFMPKLTKKMMMMGHRLLVKVRLIRHKETRIQRLTDAMDQYAKASEYFWSHKLMIFHVVLISIIQRFLLFFVTYLVYCSLGLHGGNMADIMILQATISVAVDMLPLPGGVGASESLFVVMFEAIFGESVYAGLLLSRGLSYYALILISAMVSIYAHITITHAASKRRRVREGV